MMHYREKFSRDERETFLKLLKNYGGTINGA